MGFTRLRMLPCEWWSLTPPFHPYLPKAGGYFLLHWPGSFLRRTLSGILPCGARTFLTSLSSRDRPFRSKSIIQLLSNRKKRITSSLRDSRNPKNIRNSAYFFKIRNCSCFWRGNNAAIRINASIIRIAAFCPCFLHVEAASSYELPADGVVGKEFAGKRKEIVKEFQQSLCFVVCGIVLIDAEKERLCELL